MDEPQPGEDQTDTAQILDITQTDTAPIYIGIDTNGLIGTGKTKTVYSCIETEDENNKLFTLPDDTTLDKLCIAKIDINKIILKKYSKEQEIVQEIVHYYIKNPQDFNNIIINHNIEIWENFISEYNDDEKYIDNPALYFEDELNEQIDKIKKEIELQNLFFDKHLAPKIYEDRFDEDTKMYYILEEKCGSPLLTYITIKTNQTKDNFNKIVDLVTKIADTGYINVDIKHENTCTKIEDGLLSEIIALDFDTKFFIEFDLTNEEIKKQGKIFMLTLFIAYLAKKNIVFEKDIVVKHLDYDKIKDMLTFFAGNPELCAKEMHPIFMLWYYIISKDVNKFSCSDIPLDTIEALTTRIYKFYIFPTKAGGSRKSRRPRRSKKSKKSKKSRK